MYPNKVMELIKAVEYMRESQKAFFAAKVDSAARLAHLHESKQWEKKVDELLLEVQNPQQSLF